MAPPDTPKRRGRKRSKRRTASTGPRHTSLSEESRPHTLPGSPAFMGKKGKGGKGKAGTVTTQLNCTTGTMPQKENKLDSLCHLLDNIILQHGSKEVNKVAWQPTGGGGVTAPGPAKPLQNYAGAAAPSTSVVPPSPGPAKPLQNDVAAAAPSTSVVPPSPGHAPEANKDMSREKLEKERKARKEAKKVRKGAPGKNAEERKEAHSSGHPAQQNSAAATPVKAAAAAAATPVKAAAAGTPVKAAAAAAATPVKAAAATKVKAAAATQVKAAAPPPVKAAAAPPVKAAAAAAAPSPPPVKAAAAPPPVKAAAAPPPVKAAASPVKAAASPVKAAPPPVKAAAPPPVKAAPPPVKAAAPPPVKAAAAAAATSVPVVTAGPSGESSLQPGPSTSKPAGQDGIAEKSKADLRRERREKQEAQRQAKMAAKVRQEEEKQKSKETQATEKQKTAGKVKAAGEGTRKRMKRVSGRLGIGSERRVPLLGHLPPHSPNPPLHQVNSDSIHPAVLSVGLKMKYGVVEGATARVISVLAALKRFITDYRTPEACDLSRDMADKLKPNVDFLAACRPHAIAMDNAIRSVKHKINSIDPSTPEAQAKDELRAAIDQFVEENISLASSTIATHATSLIHNDVLLTFGYSALVCDVVDAVVRDGGLVSVVVADYPHPPSGAAMVQRLDQLGVPTYYRLVTDLSHIMSKVTKVVVEAEAVMMNGAVQAMCGTASLALAAATHHKPFIVLCQTYKFCNIDLTDSLVVNELGNADSVVSCASQEQTGVLADWRDTPNLNVVHLVYDVTPASLVTVLVTEQNVLPTSAVPVIIHRKYADILGQD